MRPAASATSSACRSTASSSIASTTAISTCALGPGSGCRRLEPRQAPPREVQLGALAGEHARGRRADRSAAAVDHGHLVFEQHHAASVSSIVRSYRPRISVQPASCLLAASASGSFWWCTSTTRRVAVWLEGDRAPASRLVRVLRSPGELERSRPVDRAIGAGVRDRAEPVAHGDREVAALRGSATTSDGSPVSSRRIHIARLAGSSQASKRRSADAAIRRLTVTAVIAVVRSVASSSSQDEGLERGEPLLPELAVLLHPRDRLGQPLGPEREHVIAAAHGALHELGAFRAP